MIERKKSYKEVPGKHGKAKVENLEGTDEMPTEELFKKEDVKEEKKKPAKKKVKKGVVDTNALNVRTAPVKQNGNELGIIRKGAEVVINEADSVDGWYNITTEVMPGIKITGYAMAEFIKEV